MLILLMTSTDFFFAFLLHVMPAKCPVQTTCFIRKMTGEEYKLIRPLTRLAASGKKAPSSFFWGGGFPKTFPIGLYSKIFNEVLRRQFKIYI